MSNAKGAVIVVVVIVAAFLWATSCQKINQRHACVDSGGTWTRVSGAQYECKKP